MSTIIIAKHIIYTYMHIILYDSPQTRPTHSLHCLECLLGRVSNAHSDAALTWQFLLLVCAHRRSAHTSCARVQVGGRGASDHGRASLQPPTWTSASRLATRHLTEVGCAVCGDCARAAGDAVLKVLRFLAPLESIAAVCLRLACISQARVLSCEALHHRPTLHACAVATAAAGL